MYFFSIIYPGQVLFYIQITVELKCPVAIRVFGQGVSIRLVDHQLTDSDLGEALM